jgi:hypothetical protein
MRTKELQTIWWDWLSTSEKLLRAIHEQTAAITLRDIVRVQRLECEAQELVAHLGELDEQAGTCVSKLARSLGTEPNARGLAQVLEKAEGQGVLGLANRVTVAARTVEDVMSRNRVLLRSTTTVVDGALALLPKGPPPPGGTLKARSTYVA